MGTAFIDFTTPALPPSPSRHLDISILIHHWTLCGDANLDLTAPTYLPQRSLHQKPAIPAIPATATRLSLQHAVLSPLIARKAKRGTDIRASITGNHEQHGPSSHRRQTAPTL